MEYFFRRKKHLTIKGCPGICKNLPELEELKDDVIVVDDLQWVTDEESREYIMRLCTQGGRQLVLIGRGPLPGWLLPIDLERNILRCQEQDLLFGKKEIQALFTQSGIDLSWEDTEEIQKLSLGHPVVLTLFLHHMEGGEKLDETLKEAVRLEIYTYTETAFWEKCDAQVQEVLLAVCGYPLFTTRLAEVLTMKKNITQILEAARISGNFLIKHEKDTWEIRPFVRNFLQWKQSFCYSQEDYQENYRAAAHYYEQQDEIEKTLEYYEKAGDVHRVSLMLKENAKRHPGTAHLFEIRRFYLSLPAEELENSPVLMSGMSMLYSMMLQPEESEKWYRKLENYSKEKYLSKQEKKEAKARLTYLDIALPHRGIHGIIDILKKATVMIQNKEIQMPEFAVTGNMPSLMNGGLDFSEWSRIDKQLAVIMKKPIEIVLGDYGKGLVNIALAESGMEKGTMSDYEVQTRLNVGSMMADAGGKIEVSFAAAGALIKQHLFRGQPAVAKSTLASVRKKAENEGAVQLFLNMDAMEVWISLLLGEPAKAEAYLKSAPDEKQAFYILDRYRYMQKVRCLLALSRYEEAAGLIERLNLYFTEYERHYFWIENRLLKSILLYRTGSGDWETPLEEALEKAEHYHFIKIVAQEGAAIKPILMEWENRNGRISPEFLEEVREETARMEHFYPDYLKTDGVEMKLLTKREKEILALMCMGAQTEEICVKCGITYNSLKFHSRNIYKKLGVKNRQEAERKAAILNM